MLNWISLTEDEQGFLKYSFEDTPIMGRWDCNGFKAGERFCAPEDPVVQEGLKAKGVIIDCGDVFDIELAIDLTDYEVYLGRVLV